MERCSFHVVKTSADFCAVWIHLNTVPQRDGRTEILYHYHKCVFADT